MSSVPSSAPSFPADSYPPLFANRSPALSSGNAVVESSTLQRIAPSDGELLFYLDELELFADEHPHQAQWLPPRNFSFTPKRKSTSRPSEDGSPLRPPNAFLLFRSRVVSKKAGDGELQQSVSCIASEIWKNMSPIVKRAWRAQAQKVREQYQREIPASSSPRRRKAKIVKSVTERKQRPGSLGAGAGVLATNTAHSFDAPEAEVIPLWSPEMPSISRVAEDSAEFSPAAGEQAIVTSPTMSYIPDVAASLPEITSDTRQFDTDTEVAGTLRCQACLDIATTSIENLPCADCLSRRCALEANVLVVPRTQNMQQLALAFGLVQDLPLPQDLQDELESLFAKISQRLEEGCSSSAESSGYQNNAQ